jgi:phasin
MAKSPGGQFEVPPEVRAFTEKSVEQAKQAFDGFISAAHQTVSVFGGQASSAHSDVKNLGEKAMKFAERNIASSFDFAQQVVRANSVEDMLKLQSDYIKSQMQTLTDQARELGEHTSQIGRDAAKPKR